MEANDTSSQLNDIRRSSNYDEMLLQRSLFFADSLKDLRNIRSQLYSAAEYFEDSYLKNEHDHLLFENLKDYVSKALISTIDHLGSVTSKVNTLLDENIDEAFETNLRVLCIQQRLETCQMYSNHEGLSQQSLVIQIPKYHKQYLIPDGRFSEAVQAERANTKSSSLRRGRNERASSDFRLDLAAFSFAEPESNKGLEKRSRSLSPSRFRIKRFGPTANQPTSPIFSVIRSGSIRRSISPNTQQDRLQHRRSHSMYPEKERRNSEIEVYSKKTKNLFKAMFSIHKYKKDNSQYYK
ncbi:protein ABIL3-like [Rutidosis leptorrhynchoides]|uniref:protein ABIL3-like n=1 Tax=Rutidosis leptorrhynchoides TaxID=125765 RepID=UPI003A99A4AB